MLLCPCFLLVACTPYIRPVNHVFFDEGQGLEVIEVARLPDNSYYDDILFPAKNFPVLLSFITEGYTLIIDTPLNIHPEMNMKAISSNGENLIIRSKRLRPFTIKQSPELEGLYFVVFLYKLFKTTDGQKSFVRWETSSTFFSDDYSKDIFIELSEEPLEIEIFRQDGTPVDTKLLKYKIKPLGYWYGIDAV